SFTQSIARLYYYTTPHMSRYILLPYTTLFRSRGFAGRAGSRETAAQRDKQRSQANRGQPRFRSLPPAHARDFFPGRALRCRQKRSEEHTSELQSRFDLVCRLLLEKKKTNINSL